MRKTFISLFIIISVLLNIFFIYINIYPLLKSKPIYISDVITEKEYEELVLNGALKMLDHKWQGRRIVHILSISIEIVPIKVCHFSVVTVQA